jgi:hypothetical protein
MPLSKGYTLRRVTRNRKISDGQSSNKNGIAISQPVALISTTNVQILKALETGSANRPPPLSAPLDGSFIDLRKGATPIPLTPTGCVSSFHRNLQPEASDHNQRSVSLPPPADAGPSSSPPTGSLGLDAFLFNFQDNASKENRLPTPSSLANLGGLGGPYPSKTPPTRPEAFKYAPLNSHLVNPAEHWGRPGNDTFHSQNHSSTNSPAKHHNNLQDQPRYDSWRNTPQASSSRFPPPSPAPHPLPSRPIPTERPLPPIISITTAQDTNPAQSNYHQPGPRDSSTSTPTPTSTYRPPYPLPSPHTHSPKTTTGQSIYETQAGLRYDASRTSSWSRAADDEERELRANGLFKFSAEEYMREIQEFLCVWPEVVHA